MFLLLSWALFVIKREVTLQFVGRTPGFNFCSYANFMHEEHRAFSSSCKFEDAPIWSLHFINAILWGLFFDFVVGIDITWLRLFSYPYGIVFKISISFSTQDSSIDFSWFVHIMNNNLSFKLMLKATQMQIIIRITKFINTLELCTTAICVSRNAL